MFTLAESELAFISRPLTQLIGIVIIIGATVH